jgi:hypothetical protein
LIDGDAGVVRSVVTFGFSLLSEAEQPKTIQVSVKDAQGVSGWRADVTRS